MEVIANLRWRKSTFSGNGGPDCVEVADREGHVLVRDTKQDGRGPVLQLSVAAWRRFVAERKTTPLGLGPADQGLRLRHVRSRGMDSRRRRQHGGQPVLRHQHR
jgi:Domain of unknown function (DUF397)